MSEIISRIESKFSCSQKELLRITATAFVAAFGLTISNGWGFFNLLKSQMFLSYVVNLFTILIFAWISLYMQVVSQKIVSLKLGYLAEYEYWKNGFLISTFVCVISFGFVPLFFTGAINCKKNEKLRMGRFRYGMMHSDAGIIAAAGPFANLLLAMVVSPIYLLTGSAFVFAFIAINLLMAIFSLIPVPTFEKLNQFKGGTTGMHLFIASRWIYVLAATTVLIYSLLILIAKVFSIILALIVGIVAAIVYYRSFEGK